MNQCQFVEIKIKKSLVFQGFLNKNCKNQLYVVTQPNKKHRQKKQHRTKNNKHRTQRTKLIEKNKTHR